MHLRCGWFGLSDVQKVHGIFYDVCSYGFTSIVSEVTGCMRVHGIHT